VNAISAGVSGGGGRPAKRAEWTLGSMPSPDDMGVFWMRREPEGPYI
jgi:hypothetical protein